MKSDKPVNKLVDILTKKTFFFPDSLANDRTQDTHENCIVLYANGIRHIVPTGRSVELDEQEFAILRDAGIILPHYTYSDHEEFDPLRRNYEI